MNQKKSYLQSLKVIVLALSIAVGTSYIFADYSAPLHTPPTCLAGEPGCDAPINVGSNSQDKLGQLRVNTGGHPFATGLVVFGKSILTKGAVDPVALDVIGTTKTTDLQVTSGASAGKVLTSDASGNAIWQTPSGGGGGGAVSKITAGAGIVISPTSGVGDVTISTTPQTRVYSCPKMVGASYCWSGCVGQLSTSSACTHAQPGDCSITRPEVCTAIGYIVQ